MNIHWTDYLLARACDRYSAIPKLIGDLESVLLEPQLNRIAIDRPIYVTGLARAGTTILLMALSSLPELGSHRYKDYPLILAPYFWNRFTRLFSHRQEITERPHRDGIQISQDSPDAFEEPIWSHFFPHVHDQRAVHVLDGSARSQPFEDCYVDHIRKILLLRDARRYVSKGNYNVARIRYLARLFPDARFVVPIRHPVQHVESLVRQHRLFCEYAENDRRVGRYLADAGHFEFGPQRVPIVFSADEGRLIEQAWASGLQHKGYAVQWRAVYRYVASLLSDPTIGSRILLVRFEDLTADPPGELRRIFDFIGVAVEPEDERRVSAMIDQPRRTSSPAAESQDTIWKEVEGTARQYGYSRKDGPGSA